MKKRLLLWFALALATPVAAAPIRVDFVGAIEVVIPGSALEGVISAGTEFRGFYELDPDNVRASERLSVVNPPGRIYAEVGSLVFDSNLDAVAIENDVPTSAEPADLWLAFPFARGPYDLAPRVVFIDLSATRLSSEAYYFETSTDGWTHFVFNLYDPASLDSDAHAYGAATIVPEPGSIALLGIVGLFCLLRRTRSR